MAKNTISSKKWILVKLVETASKYGGYIYQGTFISEDLDIAHTYIDPNNRNYARWRETIGLFNQGRAVFVKGIVIKDEFFRRTDEPVINADSPIHIVDANLILEEVFAWVEGRLAEPQNPVDMIFERTSC